MNEEPRELTVNNKGLELVRSWNFATHDLDEKLELVSRARSQVERTAAALVEWLVPENAQPGERYCLAVGDAFLEVHITKEEQHTIGEGPSTWRKKPVVQWRNGHRPGKGMEFLGGPKRSGGQVR